MIELIWIICNKIKRKHFQLQTNGVSIHTKNYSTENPMTENIQMRLINIYCITRWCFIKRPKGLSVSKGLRPTKSSSLERTLHQILMDKSI